MMPAALPLRAALLRGALITLANWPVVLIDFAIESLYKLVLVVPVVGGALVAAVLASSDLRSLFAGGVRAAAGGVLSALTAAPVALAGFLAAVAVAALGGALIMYALKAATLSVLIAGERQAPEVEREPLMYDGVVRAYAYGIERLLAGWRRFGRRSVALTLWLAGAYAVIGLGYLMMLGMAIRIASRSDVGSAWPLVVLAATAAALIALALVNLVFDLMRIVVIGEDCGLRDAARALWTFLAADARQVVGIFAVVTTLFALAAAASLLVAAGLALVAWVPFIGLIVIPLQAAAWLIRGLLFQYMALSALSAYQAQFRRFREASLRRGAPAALHQVGA